MCVCVRVGGWVYVWMYVWVLESMCRCWGVSALGAFVGVASARMYLCVYPGGLCAFRGRRGEVSDCIKLLESVRMQLSVCVCACV